MIIISTLILGLRNTAATARIIMAMALKKKVVRPAIVMMIKMAKVTSMTPDRSISILVKAARLVKRIIIKIATIATIKCI